MTPGLYAIVDVESLAREGRDPVTFAARILEVGRLAALQLRAKGSGAREMLSLARALAPRCRDAATPLVVNDRPDVALLAGAEGVHVGTDDLPVDAVRALAPGLLVGASNHTDEDVIACLATAADYVAFGPVFATTSKRDAAPVVGLEALSRVASRCAPRPVVAIGGIDLSNASQVRAAGARAGAVIGALRVDDAEVTARARALHRALGGES